MYPPFNPHGFVKAETESHHWHSGSAFRTQYFNALSMCFPELERRMIQSVRATLAAVGDQPQVRDLREPARNFIAQEASHSQIHSRLNAHRVNPNWPVLVNWVPKGHIAQRSWLSNLARTCGIEHLTTLLAVYVFRQPTLFKHVPPSIRDIWLWHAAEEIEHQCLTLNLYRAAGGGYLRRIAYFFLIVVTANTTILAQTLTNLAHDGQLLKPRTWRDACVLFWGRQGLAWFFARHLPTYLRRDFNPKDHHREACATALRWLRDYRGRGLDGQSTHEETSAHSTDPGLV